MTEKSFYLFSIIILSIILYYPVNKLIYVLSVRRLEKKTQNKLVAEELKGQLVRSRFITIIIVLIFSSLFNFKYF